MFGPKLICILYFCFSIDAYMELTNMVCTPLDKSFLDFDYCYIKAINRSYKYLSVKANLFKLPVRDATVNIAILKKANGYKPFLYNITFDACKFLKSRKNILLNFFFGIIEDYSNFNHTCPYNHDVMVDKLPSTLIGDRVFKVLPIPDGEYCVHTEWTISSKLRAIVRVFGRFLS